MPTLSFGGRGWRSAVRALVAGAGLALVACSENSGTTAPLDLPTPVRLSTIRDAARGNGVPGFYWITPIAPTLTSYPGLFDGGRDPVVQICVWNGSACDGPPIATYSRTTGTNGLRLQVVTAGEHYRVDWPTAGLTRGTLYRIRTLEGTTELGAATAKIPATNETPAMLTAQGIVPLSANSRLPIRFRLEVNQAPTVAITGPSNEAVVPVGGTLNLSGTASDAEEGDLSAQIVWRTDRRPEPLGTGAALSVSNLPSGRQTITASVTDANGRTASTGISIVVSIVSVPPTLTVALGGTASLPITLSEPAPAGGLTLAVSSETPERVAVVTEVVTIPAGASAVNATVSGAGPGGANVRVANADFGEALSQVTTTAELSLQAVGGATFVVGRSASLRVSLRSNGADAAAPAGGLPLTLTSSDPSCVAVPVSVTIPAGQVNATVTAEYGGTPDVPCSAAIVASAPGVAGVSPSGAVTMRVNPAPAIVVQTGNDRIGSGLRGGCYRITFGAPAPAGGVEVTVASADASRLRVAVARSGGNCSVVPPATVAPASGSVTFTLAEGSSTAELWVDALEGQTAVSSPITISATAAGYQLGTGTLRVAPVALSWRNPPPATTTSLSPNQLLAVSVGPTNDAGTEISGGQPVRPGGVPIPVTLTSSAPSVAQLLVFGGPSAPSATTTIEPGERETPPSSLAPRALLLDPIAAGETTVSISALPGVVIGGSQATPRTVTVTAPGITVSTGNGRVGAGLRGGCYLLDLAAPAPAGGVEVTVGSADPSRLRVAVARPWTNCSAPPATEAPESGSVTFTMPSSSSRAEIWVDAMEGQSTVSAPIAITASAPGFQSGSGTLRVTPVAYGWRNPPTPTNTSLSPNQFLAVSVGPTNDAGTELSGGQPVRPGGTPLTVTLTNSNAAAAQLVVVGGVTGQSVSTIVGPGERETPLSSIAPGALLFDPLGAGETTVSISGPAGVVIGGAIASPRTVTIAAPTITVGTNNGRIGAGLRGGCYLVDFGAPAPAGGLEVTVASADPAVLRVAVARSFSNCSSPPNSEAPASGSVTFTLAPNTSRAELWVDALEGRTTVSAPVTITASAPGFQTGSGTLRATPAAFSWRNQPSATTTTLSPNQFMAVSVGATNDAGTASDGSAQSVRPGGSPLAVTLANSNASVAQLVVVGGATGQTVSTSIAVGANATPLSSVTPGALLFDPLASGETTVSISGPPGVVAAGAPVAPRTVTVSAPTIAVGNATLRVGQTQTCASISLGAPLPAGTTVTIALSSGSVAQVAPVTSCGGTVVGSPGGSIVLSPPAGTISVFYAIIGGPSTGSALITASAPGYVNGTGTVTVNP